jgi:CheY-like chemotaxis protein
LLIRGVAMSTTASPSKRPKRILVVDDDPDVRLIAALMLGAVGYEVDTAEDAYDALLTTYDTHPDLMLLDLMLPEKDGWDVIEAVRANPETRDLPIVLMSAKIGLISTGHHGVQGYVSKPLVPMAMLDTLHAVLADAPPTANR